MAPWPALTSRHGEDFLILSVFAGQKRGFYIDVGAFDGVYGSRTWALEQLGWSGICIEPAPEVFPLLTKNRSSALCVEAASGAGYGIGTLSMDPTLQFRSLQPMERVRSAYEDSVEFHGLESGTFSTVDVEIVTLNGLLSRTQGWGTIDLLTIDAEAAEHEVLAGLDLALHTPRLIIVTSGEESVQQRVKTRLEEAGYGLCRTLNQSTFFAAEPAVARRLRKTAINCFIPRNLHPHGLAHTRLPLRNDRILLHGHEYILEELATRMAEVSAMNGSVPARDGS